MGTITRENIAPLNDKLTLKLEKNDYLPTFEKSLKEYAKKATIPGFRKGMVPTGVVKKMYGQSVFTEEVYRSVEKQLNDYLNQEKLDIFSQPLPLDIEAKKFDINNPEDYSFAFEIGLKPAINIDFSDISVTRYKPEVTEKMIDEEVERLQTRNGKMTEPEVVDNDENVLNLQFTETDGEGNVIENGINKANSLLVKYFTENSRKELMGKKKDDTINIQLSKAFEEKEREWVISDLGLNKDNAADAEKFFNITITKVGFVEKAELNEELFEKVYPGKEIKTAEDFRNAVKTEIENYYKTQTSNQIHDQIYHHLIDHTKIDFPEDFLKRLLQSGKEAVTAEEAEKEFPAFKNQLKWSLISSKLLQENNITVEQQEIKDAAMQQMLGYMGGQGLGDAPWLDEYAGRMLKDKKFVEETYMQLQTTKLFNALETKVHETEESISVEAFAEKLHHHHH
jgi:trigger factor